MLCGAIMLQKLRSLLSRPSAPSVPFQVLSDLHLEINQQYPSFEIPVCANSLILAGDVGRLADYDRYLEFLQKQTERFEIVFLVLGNHEFYKESFTMGLEKAKQLEREPSLNGRLILLHQRRYDIPDSHVTILGCTLWSKVPNEARDIVKSKIQDFRQIQDWTVDDHNAAHDADHAWLLREIQSICEENQKLRKQDQPRTILVVTHHAPSLRKTSSPRNENNPWSCAFGTDLLSHTAVGVKVWVFGHTHYTTEFVYRGTNVVSNQREYVLGVDSEKTRNGFDVGKVIYV